MDNILAVVTTILCWLFVFAVERKVKDNGKSLRQLILRYKYVLHPNAITIGALILALISMRLYHLQFPRLAIILFLIAAFADAIDGVIARGTGLVTSLGKEIDPLCDKIKYFIPLIYFAYQGLLSKELVIILFLIYVTGQLLRRSVSCINKNFKLKFKIASNGFGKIKTILALLLVVYCCLLQQRSGVPDFANHILFIVLILATLSVVFKFVKNKATKERLV